MPAEPRRIALGLAVAVALAAGAAAVLLLGVEWVEQEVDLGYGPEARRSRYLAAAHYLERQAIAVEPVSGYALLDDLPPRDELLMLPASRVSWSRRRLEALRGWLAGGGRAVVVAEEWSDPETLESRDPLLAGYGLHRLPIGGEDGRPAAPEPGASAAPAAAPAPDAEAEAATGSASEPSAAELPGSVGDLLDLALPGELPECWEEELAPPAVHGERVFRLELAEGGALFAETAAGALSRSPDGDDVLHARVGEGGLTVLTSARIFTNPRIHCHDHAWFLWSLAQGADRVWWVADPDVAPLPVVVARSLPLASIGAGLWLAVWLAHVSLRFGRAPPPADGVRRRWLEHLEAGAGFRWRHGQLAATLATLRDDVEARAAARLPGYVRAGGEARRRLLAARCAVSLDEVDRALSAEPPDGRRELTRRVARLQTLRRRL